MSYWFPVCSKVVQFNCENLGCLEKEENRKLEDKKESESCSVFSDSLWPHGLYSPQNSPGQPGDLLNPGINPGLPDCRRILYQLSHQGSPRILKCVAYAFSRGFSRPRNGTRVSCIAGGFFTSWATREALLEEDKTGKQGAIPMVRGTLPTTLLGIPGWLFDALVEMNLGISHL